MIDNINAYVPYFILFRGKRYFVYDEVDGIIEPLSNTVDIYEHPKKRKKDYNRLKQMRAYAAKHRKEQAEYDKQYHRKNRERFNEYQREYARKHSNKAV